MLPPATQPVKHARLNNAPVPVTEGWRYKECRRVLSRVRPSAAPAAFADTRVTTSPRGFEPRQQCCRLAQLLPLQPDAQSLSPASLAAAARASSTLPTSGPVPCKLAIESGTRWLGFCHNGCNPCLARQPATQPAGRAGVSDSAAADASSTQGLGAAYLRGGGLAAALAAQLRQRLLNPLACGEVERRAGWVTSGL